MKVHFIEDADLTTLRNVMRHLYDDKVMTDGARRDMANLMKLIIDRVIVTEIPEKEPEHG